MSQKQYFFAFGLAASLLTTAPALAIERAADKKATKTGKDDSATAARLGKPQKVRFRVGAEITASRGACRNIVAMVAVPIECAEQQVTNVEEDFSPEVREVTYRPLPGGEVKQMLISIPFLADGATAHAIVTTEITTHTVLPPEETKELKIPKKIPSKLKIYTL